MRRICILALVGLPAAGKTTFSKWLLAQPNKCCNIIHLCYDDYFQFKTDFNDKTDDYKKQRLGIYEVLRTLVTALKSGKALATILPSYMDASIAIDSNDFIIICDDNNYYRSMRYKLYQLCKSEQIAFAQIYFECELKIALTRNVQRAVDEIVPENIIVTMAHNMQTPDMQTNAWESAILKINTEPMHFSNELIMPFISSSFQNVPVLTETASNSLHTTSLLHQLDILLRRRIGQLLTEMPSTTSALEKHTRALLLNNKRRDIMQQLKRSNEVYQVDLTKYVNMLQ